MIFSMFCDHRMHYCTQLLIDSKNDGEGGSEQKVIDGDTFETYYTYISSGKTRIGESEYGCVRFKVVAPHYDLSKVPNLHIDDIFRTCCYPFPCRVISEPIRTPESSAMSFVTFEAEMYLHPDMVEEELA